MTSIRKIDLDKTECKIEQHNHKSVSKLPISTINANELILSSTQQNHIEQHTKVNI